MASPHASDGHDRDARPARHPVRVPGAELGDQPRAAARPRGRGARRDDRRHRRAPAAVERRPPGLAAAAQPAGAVPVSGTGHETRTAAVGAALRPAHAASRWSSPTPPATTASPATRTSPTSTAARCWPCPSSAAARCGRCCCWRTASSAARSPPNGSTRSSSSPASSPSPSTTPSSTPTHRLARADRRRRRPDPPAHRAGPARRRPAAAGQPRPASCARRRRGAARGRRAGRAAGRLAAEATSALDELRELARGIHPASSPTAGWARR